MSSIPAERTDRRSPGARGRPLRVGLNLLFLGERAGGVGRYATELPGALLEAEPQTEIHVFVSRDAPDSLRREPWAERVRWTTLPVHITGPPLHLPAQFLGLPALSLVRRLDVLHSPANVGPVVVPGAASVVTLHDLIWLHRGPEWEPDARARTRMHRLVRHCVRHADRVFAVSRAAAEDFVATLGVPRERIEAIPSGVRPPRGYAEGAARDASQGTPSRDAATPESQLRASLELGDTRVVLCVAQKRPYKNLHSLIRALPALPDDVTLVLPGSPTPYEDELRALARELEVELRVRFPQWLSDADLEGLYALASAFVLPSLIEGFGLPLLEAMARGVPVACSNTSALPEVTGDAALLFDPHDQQQITAALRRLLQDRALAERLVARGHARVRELTWRRTGEASLAGYRRAIAARGGGRPGTS